MSELTLHEPKVPRKYTRYDWSALESKFVTSGSTSMLQFAQENGVGYDTLRAVANKNNWQDKRKTYNKERASKSVDATLATQVEQDVAKFRSAEDIRADVHRLSGHITQRITSLFFDEHGQPRSTLPTPKQLKEAVEALDKSYTIEMDSGGHTRTATPTQIDARLLVAGVTAEQLESLDDATIDQTLEAVQRAVTGKVLTE